MKKQRQKPEAEVDEGQGAFDSIWMVYVANWPRDIAETGDIPERFHYTPKECQAMLDPVGRDAEDAQAAAPVAPGVGEQAQGGCPEGTVRPGSTGDDEWILQP